ncbi:MAG TPA: hypothetical protein VF070_41095 [Streptosporangiaceae bacterium]
MSSVMVSSPAASSDLAETDRQDMLGRRKFLRRATGLGAAVVGAIAVTWADAPAAFAAFDEGCCGLATRTPCGGAWGKDGTFNCPSGTSKKFWTCYTQPGNRGFLYHCWECDNGSNCFNGSVYKCSNYWDIYIG